MKTLKRNTNRILSMLFAIFMTVCAFLSLTALLPKASASADETIDVEAVYNNCTFEEYEDGASVVGKYLHFKVNDHGVETIKAGLWLRQGDMMLYIQESEGSFTLCIQDHVNGEVNEVYNYPYLYVDPEATTINSINFFCIYFPETFESIDFTTALGPTYNSTREFTITEMIPLPTVNGSDAPDSVPGGSSINPNGPGKAESVSDWEIFGLVALSILELVCVVAYIAKAPGGGGKWILTLILLGVFVSADIGLYLYFAGLI